MYQDVIATCRLAAIDAASRFPTAGFVLGDSRYTPCFTNSETANKILDAIGAGASQRDGTAEKILERKLALYTSASVLALLNIIAVQLGLEFFDLAFPAMPVPEGKTLPRPARRLPTQALALVASFVSSHIIIIHCILTITLSDL